MVGVIEALRISAPSVLTISALVSGLSAVRFASEEHFSESVTCVMIAAVLDGLDGHVARYLDACTKLGFELDSLCDLANFGVTPALVVYFWAKTLPAVECWSERCWVEHTLLWISCCAHAGCCALRLARFNVTGHAAQMEEAYMEGSEGQRPPAPTAVMHNVLQRRLYFQGVPAPIGAAYALAPMMLRFSAASRSLGVVGDVGAWAIGRRGTSVTLFVTAALMVSPLPTLSSKMLKTHKQDSHFRSRHCASRAAKVVAGLFCCFAGYYLPFDVLLLLDLAHFLSLPVGIVIYCRFACNKGE